MANYTTQSNVRRALTTLLPALKTYIDNKEPDLSATNASIAAMQAVVEHDIPWSGPFFEAVPYLREGKSIPTAIRERLTVLPYFEGAKLYTSQPFRGCTLLEEIGEGYDFSGVGGTWSQYVFRDCAALMRVPRSLFDTCSPGMLDGWFYGCAALTEFDAPPRWYESINGTNDLRSTFYHATSLTAVGEMNTCNARSFWGTFQGCSSLGRVEGIDATAATDLYAVFYGCTQLQYALIRNIGGAKGLTHAMSGYAGMLEPVLLTNCKAWGSGTEEALDALRRTFSTELFDRTAAGYDTVYIVLDKEVMERLDPDTIAAANAKGFTLIGSPNVWVLIDGTTFGTVDFNGHPVDGCTVHRAPSDPWNELNPTDDTDTTATDDTDQ